MAVGIQREALVAHLAAPAENDVGEGEQRALAIKQSGGRVLELRELVHAVIDDRPLAEPAGVGCDGHGVVEPKHGALEAAVQLAGERLEDEAAALEVDEGAVVPARGGQVDAQEVRWWIEPVLRSLDALPLMLGATVLTAFNDNAAITYLASLVPGFSDEMKYAVVAGAVAGGGLTVIANAPNPAGQSILSPSFKDGIAPGKLFVAAFLPTVIMGLAFLLLPS